MKKRYVMICLLILSVTVVGLAANSSAISETGDEIPEENQTGYSKDNIEITVKGTGKVKVEPDRAVVKIGILAKKPTASGAWQNVGETSEEVLVALRGIGISEDDMETTDYDLQTRWDRHHEDIIGYTCRYDLRIEVTDLDDVGRVIDVAVEAGANRVYSIEFTRDEAEIEEAKMDAYKLAAESTRMKAESIADAFGARVIGITDIQVDGQNYDPWVYRYQDSAIRSGGVGFSTQVLPGDVEAKSRLTVTYEIGWD